MKHKHHIIPRHAGGTDCPENLVELTIEEHAEAHKKLYEKYGKVQDKLAWMGLSKMITGQDILKELLSAPKSDEHKRKISMAHKGKKKPFMIGNTNAKGNAGKVKSVEHKQKLSEATLGKKRPDMIGNKLAAGNRTKTEKHQKKITAALNTEQSKLKAKATRAARPLVTCPHCGVDGKKGHNMSRFHFNNCKRKE
jgi:hypothetical protein